MNFAYPRWLALCLFGCAVAGCEAPGGATDISPSALRSAADALNCPENDQPPGTSKSPSGGEPSRLGPASLMTLSTNQGTVVADGAHTTQVTATWTDVAGRPLIGQTVYFTSSSPNARLSQTQFLTNCAGQVKIAWGSTKAGQQTLYAGGPTYRLARAQVNFTCPGTFLRPRSWPVFSAQAVAVVAKDFNADGFVDLAAAEPSSNVVEVIQGFGNGLFDVPVAYAVGSIPRDILSLDINADGVADLLAANAGSNSLSLLVGNPNGSFVNLRTFAVGNGPVALAGVDLNADGNQDVVAVNSNSNTISVLFGNGNSLGAPTTYSTGSSPVALATADLNLDGRVDVIVANANSLSIFLGSGNGNLTSTAPLSLPASPTSLAAADYNGDRRQDLAVSCANTNAVYLLLGNGDGTFGPANALSVPFQSPAQLRALDLNRDGYADLFVANSGGNTLTYLQGAASGNFALSGNVPAGNNPNALCVSDFNGDGLIDFGVTTAGGPVAILQGNTSFGLTPLPHNVLMPRGTYVMAVADLDRDGRQDLLTSDKGYISQFRGLGDGTFNVVNRLGIPNGSGYALAVGDLNNGVPQAQEMVVAV
jgi:hypothetical protein